MFLCHDSSQFDGGFHIMCAARLLIDPSFTKGVYLEYVKKHLAPSQIDQVDIAPYLGSAEKGNP